MNRFFRSLPFAVVLGIAMIGMASLAGAEDRQDLDAVQYSVAGLIQKLVARGVMTQKEAEAMVSQARTKAVAEVAATKSPDPKPGDVRVTYVPQIVRDEIKNKVKEELRGEVRKEVVADAQRDGWGVPGALPQWVNALRISGDVRLREEVDLYSNRNALNIYRDFQAINNAGGIGAAGTNGFLITSQDRYASRGRLRLNVDAQVAEHWRAGLRLTTGNLSSPVTRNANLANSNRPVNFVVDRYYIDWSAGDTYRMMARGGRMPNPWMGSDLIWDDDLTFEGLTMTGRWVRPGPGSAQVFLTAGAFPLQDVELKSRDPWLLGGQLGARLYVGDQAAVSFSAGLFDYRNVVGLRNTPASNLNDFSAPAFLQKGNTLFDIRNDTDPNTQLFGLAADYRLFNANVLIDLGAWCGCTDSESDVHVRFIGDYVKNVGFNENEVAARVGQRVKGRTTGYEGRLQVGWPQLSQFGAWRATGMWKYLERDAVLDAFAESDFHLGGTDAKGWTFMFEYGLSPATNLRLRYMSADEIDGPPLAIDVVQLDLNARF